MAEIMSKQIKAGRLALKQPPAVGPAENLPAGIPRGTRAGNPRDGGQAQVTKVAVLPRTAALAAT